MKTTLYYLATLFLVLWIQMAGDYFLGATGFSVNVVLVIVLYFGLSRGPMAGQLFGLIGGLLVDASSLGLMGLHAMLYAGAGYLAGMFRRQLDERKAWTQTIFTIGVSVIYLLLFVVLDRVFSVSPHPLSWASLAQPMINGVIAPVLFLLMQEWGQLWNILPHEE
jgi:rod shape-determining protein MreD